MQTRCFPWLDSLVIRLAARLRAMHSDRNPKKIWRHLGTVWGPNAAPRVPFWTLKVAKKWREMKARHAFRHPCSSGVWQTSMQTSAFCNSALFLQTATALPNAARTGRHFEASCARTFCSKFAHDLERARFLATIHSHAEFAKDRKKIATSGACTNSDCSYRGTADWRPRRLGWRIDGQTRFG